MALRYGVWAYFLLLILEGALRKWFLPFLATPLLVVRDPVAVWILYRAWRMRLLPTANPYLLGMAVIGISATLLALIVGHGSLPVAVFGARMFLVHWPLMFAIGAAFDREEVLRIGRATLWIAIPMTVIVALQFFSPQSAWINRTIGGDEGAGFSGAMGFFRPPGTFSFTSGNTQFYGFLAAFLMFFWISPRLAPRIAILGATLGLLATIPLSISRSLLFQVIVALGFLAVAVSRKPQYAGRLAVAGLLVAGLFIGLRETAFFQASTGAFTARFDSANKAEGGVEGVLLDRYLGGLVGALTSSYEQPLWGYGLGMGTNVGSSLLSGKTSFLISEGEWGRLVGELGIVLGLSAILLRTFFSLGLLFRSYKRVVRNDVLPWMLMSFALFTIPQGQWAQPTALGFSTLIGGLALASLRQQGSSGAVSTE